MNELTSHLQKLNIYPAQDAPFSQSSDELIDKYNINRFHEQDSYHLKENSRINDESTLKGSPSWTLSDEQSIDNAVQKIAPNLTPCQIEYIQTRINAVFLGACKGRSCNLKYDSATLRHYSTENLEKSMLELAKDMDQLKSYIEIAGEVKSGMKTALNHVKSMMREGEMLMLSRQKEDIFFRMLYREVLNKGITKALSDQNLTVKDRHIEELINLLTQFAEKDIPESLQKIKDLVTDIKASSNNFPLASEDLKKKTIQLWKDEALKIVSDAFAPIILNYRDDLNPYFEEKVLPL